MLKNICFKSKSAALKASKKNQANPKAVLVILDGKELYLGYAGVVLDSFGREQAFYWGRKGKLYQGRELDLQYGHTGVLLQVLNG